MTLNTFSPVPAPSPGTNKKVKPKLLKADFGEGYTQYAADGMNSLKQTVTLTWDLLLPSQSDAIMNFFAGQGGWQPFYYTISDDVAGPLRWLCEDWTEERGQGGIRKVTASLTQYFGVLY